MQRIASAGLVVVLSMGGMGCASTSKVERQQTGPSKSQGHGPPPHAPAHGYRAKSQNGVELVFRSDLGVYVVVGASGYYFQDEHFYHRSKAGWEIGDSLEGPWKAVSESQLPPGL